MLRVSNSWTPPTRSVTDLHDDKMKIDTSIIFQIDTKNRKCFNPLQLYKFCLLRELLLMCIKHLHMYQPS